MREQILPGRFFLPRKNGLGTRLPRHFLRGRKNSSRIGEIPREFGYAWIFSVYLNRSLPFYARICTTDDELFADAAAYSL